jgi:hypothetical protein
MFILDSITPRETKEAGIGETKKSELEDPGTFEENNDRSTFHSINILLIMYYIILINVSLIAVNTPISIYFGMEWNLSCQKVNH